MLVADTEGSIMRRISNSEVQTWNTCQNQYRYAFDMAIAPKRYGPALGKGILFHDAIAKYYLCIANGGSINQALVEAQKIVTMELIKNDEYGADVCAEVNRLLIGYSAYYGIDPQWEIIEVEQSYDMPMNDQYTMPMRLDLLVRDRATHEILLVDHKTCYNFFTDRKIALYGQIPKYTGALRINGRNVNGVLLNMIRTRTIKAPTPDQLWKRQKVLPSSAKIRNVLKEHILSCEDITAYRAKPDIIRPQAARKILNDVVCGMCPFADLCMSELDGGDITYALKADFRANPYNYNPASDINVLEML